MIIDWLHIQSKRENINFRIKKSSIFHVNQIYKLEPCLAISLEIATRSGRGFSLEYRNFKMTVLQSLSYCIT